MSIRLGVSLAAIGIVCGAVFSSLAAAPADGSTDVEALKKENAELRAKCEALEAKLAEIQSKNQTTDTKPSPDKTTAPKEAGQRALAARDLNDLLIQMDSFVERRNKAATTILKDEALKAMYEKADTMMKGDLTAVVTAQVKDVAKSADGLTTLNLVGVRMAELEKVAYLRRPKTLLSVSKMPTATSVVLRMSESAAKQIKPGQPVQLSGVVGFFPRQWPGAPAGSLQVLHFDIQGMMVGSGGTVRMKINECQIEQSKYALK